MEIGGIKGKIEGTAVIRDKNGNVKGHLKFGGDATLEEVAQLTGKSPEQIREILSSQENQHGRDSDHSRS